MLYSTDIYKNQILMNFSWFKVRPLKGLNILRLRKQFLYSYPKVHKHMVHLSFSQHFWFLSFSGCFLLYYKDVNSVFQRVRERVNIFPDFLAHPIFTCSYFLSCVFRGVARISVRVGKTKKMLIKHQKIFLNILFFCLQSFFFLDWKTLFGLSEEGKGESKLLSNVDIFLILFFRFQSSGLFLKSLRLKVYWVLGNYFAEEKFEKTEIKRALLLWVPSVNCLLGQTHPHFEVWGGQILFRNYDSRVTKLMKIIQLILKINQFSWVWPKTMFT